MLSTFVIKVEASIPFTVNNMTLVEMGSQHANTITDAFYDVVVG